ncbi:alcohol dehydrogenase catalytic domain-containing protein [Bacillus sp. B15-48]|uniref:zinc-binding dehydrogenase n=1 Tax=Bacillus sp. B15-48 TaxID=1548601 RepID=UPI00193F3FBF|nr:alcohol dehydrogenase catalytic domain-containing protein [Bacillus sp. B15-48]MBM4761814.1 alcohol dehydrogenase catalytic domain-containing protein [Bacillus sp. B15-48]
MKALVLEDVYKLVLTDVPDPTTDKDGVIVKVQANGVCRSDWHVWAGELASGSNVLGHELTGIIEEVGSEVKNFKKGDRVIVPITGSEGSCPHCLKGNVHLCESPDIPGFTYSGGFGEYVPVPHADRNLVHLPEEVGFTEGAALGCRVMTSYHGIVDIAKVRPGETVVVYGCGGIGLSAIHIANSLGAHVIGVDINDANLALAKEMGAIHTINSKNVNPIEAVQDLTGGGANVSVDALGIAQTCVNAIHSLRKGGRHLQIGVTSKAESGFISIPIDEMLMKGIHMYTTLGLPVHRFDTLLASVARGDLQPGRMVSGEISLADVNRVFEDMKNFSNTGTYVITNFS